MTAYVWAISGYVLYPTFSCLQLKQKAFQTYASSTPQKISTFWSAIIAIDETLVEGGRQILTNMQRFPGSFNIAAKWVTTHLIF